MPFCTACGNNVDAGTKFCPKCGASMSGGAAAARPAATTQPAKSGGALKVVLIILGVCLLLGMLAVGGAIYTAYRVAKAAKQQAQQTMGSGIKIETPTGTVSIGAGDTGKAGETPELDVYPGAVAEQNTSKVAMGGLSVASAIYTTGDPPSKVADWYRKQYPKPMVFSQQGDHTSMIVNTDKGMVTLVIEPFDGKTKITIAHMGDGKSPETQESK